MPHELYLMERKAECLRHAAASTSIRDIDGWIDRAILCGALMRLRFDPQEPQRPLREQSMA